MSKIEEFAQKVADEVCEMYDPIDYLNQTIRNRIEWNIKMLGVEFDKEDV